MLYSYTALKNDVYNCLTQNFANLNMRGSLRTSALKIGTHVDTENLINLGDGAIYDVSY